jgi:hypothetical protein
MFEKKSWNPDVPFSWYVNVLNLSNLSVQCLSERQSAEPHVERHVERKGRHASTENENGNKKHTPGTKEI